MVAIIAIARWPNCADTALTLDFGFRGCAGAELALADGMAPTLQSRPGVARIGVCPVPQVLTYLELTNLGQALLVNFNVRRLTDGLKSYLRSLHQDSNHATMKNHEAHEGS
jgi:hypothetical protein